MIATLTKPKQFTLAVSIIALLGLVVCIVVSTSCQNSLAETSKDEAPETACKIVIIAGQPSHASGQHEFNAGSMILARCLNQQSGLPHSVTVVHSGWPEDESVLDGADAVIIYSDGNNRHPVKGHEETFDEMVAKGLGVMFMHYGVEVPAGERGDYFKRWIGGHYEAGFSTNPHWTAELTLDADHPIANGVEHFSANDEWYYQMRFAEPKTARDILTAIPTRERISRYVHWTPQGEQGLGTRQTMMWAVEREDGGRGIGFTGGHYHRNWAIDDYRRTILNAIVWVAGGQVPEHGVQSESLTEDQLNENLDPKKKMARIKLPSAEDLNQPAAEPVDFRWPGKPKNKGKK